MGELEMNEVLKGDLAIESRRWPSSPDLIGTGKEVDIVAQWYISYQYRVFQEILNYL